MFKNRYFFLKVISLQVLWYFFVSIGANDILGFYAILISLFIYLINLKLYPNSFSKIHNLMILSFFILYAFFETILFSSLGILVYEKFPYWLVSLYVIFLCYYGDIFNYLEKKNIITLSLLGAVGGGFAFYAGVGIAGLKVISPQYYLGIILSWGFFFPLSIKMYYSKDLKNKILDLTIIKSFDKSGFERHKEYFSNDIEFTHGDNILITGGSSGIGLATAKELSLYHANVIITGRDEVKGMSVANKISGLKFLKLDMMDWDYLDEFVEKLPILNGIVLNAGGMPETFITNNYGVEAQMASQLFGHYFLLKKLVEKNKIKKGSKIIWVSSGGMYLKKLHLKYILENSKYDKVETYAIVKKAQVELLDLFQNEFSEYFVIGMHPGWVDTPGIRSAISGFAKLMDKKLRTPLQGADTIIWALSLNSKLNSGSFYFDRKIVKKNVFFFTKVNPFIVKKLYLLLNDYFKKLSKE